jgi:hypothetical protein
MKLALGACALVVACSCARSSPPTTAEPLPPQEPSSVVAPAPVVPPPAPVGAIIVRNGAKPGELELVAREDVDVSVWLGVERETADGAFEDFSHLDLGGLKLVEKCPTDADAPFPPCIHLTKGQTLRPVPWTGYSCSSQCNHECTKNVYYADQRFRFVVKTCKSGERFEAPVFQVPKAPPP